MNTLEQFLTQIGMNQLSSSQTYLAQWQYFCARHHSLFDTVTADKPELDVALGLFTKAHIEAITQFEDQSQAAKGVILAIEDNLAGQKNAFQLDAADELEFVTHGWLYLQGYLAMDFSLANDHAHQTAHILTQTLSGNPEEKRSMFLSSYYIGKERRPVTNSPQGLARLVQWLKSL